MNFHSTLDRNAVVSSARAIVEGISPDGGLYVPEEFPKLADLNELAVLDYRQLAAYILNLYFDDLGSEQVESAAFKAYDDKFIEGVVPVKQFGNAAFLELFHGRTLAFKDIALSVLPHLMTTSLKQLGVDKDVIVLVATSGDTGKAALEGFSDVEGAFVAVYFPDGGVSEVQRLQMVTSQGGNTFVAAIRGNFDDAQTGVKTMFADSDLRGVLSDRGYMLSSANSINIGRLIPQIVYYVHGYLELMKKGTIEIGDKINVVVPTGNFGNILAAYYAKRMGLPINNLICASNDNRVLTDFFETGEYDANRPLFLTSSPSMDILISSNLERFIYHISNGDEEKTRRVMAELKEDRLYNWGSVEEEGVIPACASEEEVSDNIEEVYNGFGYVMDPHTAVAYTAYKKYLSSTGDDIPTLICATASPFKFSKKVLFSISKRVPEDEMESVELLSTISGIPVPTALGELKELDPRHRTVCNVDDMKKVLLREYLGGNR